MPNSIDMVALLGARDEFLRIVEKEFDADIMVRGNEISMSGEPAELALAERLVDELIAVVRTGHGLTADSVERSIGSSPSRAGRISGEWKGADTGSSNARLAPRPCSAGMARSTATRWPAITVCSGLL